ncbi:MAG: tetratricopeptide repeat protein [Bacteroidia bacterium]|nr:tetratricopeptide repeat protein [Bacteroidia bacterium]
MCCDRYPHIYRRGLHILPIVVLALFCQVAASTAWAQSPDALLDSARSLLTNDPARAATVAHRALVLAVSEQQKASALYVQGSALRKLGKNAGAMDRYREALAHAQRSGDVRLQALVLSDKGKAHRLMGFLDHALNDHLKALALYDSLRDGAGAATAMNDVAITLRNLQRYTEARRYHDRALAQRRALDDLSGIAASLCGIGNLYWYAGNLDSAETYYRQALEMERNAGQLSENVAGYLNNLANVYRERGNFREAHTKYQESLRLSDLVGDMNMRAVTLKNLGILYARSGELRRAEAQLREAAAVARDNGLARVYAESMDALPSVYERLGDLRMALQAMAAASKVKDSLGALLSAERLANAEALYQSEKHQRSLRELDSEKQTYYTRFLFVSAILLLVVVAGTLFWLSTTRKQNRELAGRSERAEAMHAQLEAMHEQVARSEEQYRLLFEGLPVGVFFYDNTLRVIQANHALADILAIAPEQCDGYDLYQLQSQRVLEALSNGLNADHGMYEGPFLPPGSTESIMVSLRTAPLRVDAGLRGAVGFLLDISDWKQVERELLGAKEAAEQAVRLKQAFLISISHEIRTPLNVIMGYVSVLFAALVERISTGEKEYFEKIDLAVRRLTRTVDQLLSLSILESGGYALEPEYLDICALVEQLVDETRSIAEDKKIPVTFRAPDRSVFIRADKYSVSQALRNLLDNAVKFTDEGEITVTISVREPDVIINVADTGIGISESYLRQLYVAFTQENVGYTRPYDGLGLGLTLTKRYVDANNGGITVKSTKGLGSTFTIAFMEATGSQTTQHLAEERVAAAHPAHVTLLVVEDDHETQKFLNLVLSDDYTMHFADSADDAWTILHQHRIDIVLMDISLRGEEDGLSLTRRIRAEAGIAKIPVIAVTAHAFTEDKRRSYEAGCDDYLAKPFRTQQLRERIQRQINRIASLA